MFEIKIVHDITPSLRHLINHFLRTTEMTDTQNQAELLALIASIGKGKGSDPALVEKVGELSEQMISNNITDEQQQELIVSLIHAVKEFNAPVGPVVLGLSIKNGGIDGGNAMVIFGTGFLNATKVKAGDNEIVPYSITDDTMINMQMPAHEAGTVNITVETPKGVSAKGTANQYTYT